VSKHKTGTSWRGFNGEERRKNGAGKKLGQSKKGNEMNAQKETAEVRGEGEALV